MVAAAPGVATASAVIVGCCGLWWVVVGCGGLLGCCVVVMLWVVVGCCGLLWVVKLAWMVRSLLYEPYYYYYY